MLKKLEHILQNEIDPAFNKRSKFIFEELEKQKPKVILDIGCGRGFYVKSLSFYKFPKKIFGIDINDKYLLKANKNCHDRRIIIKKGSIYSLPFEDNYFDFIICSELLEHLKDDKRGLKELSRILKKNGTIAITVPNYNFPFFWDPLNWILMRFFNTHIDKNIWWLAGIWADHERLYKEKELEKIVNKYFQPIEFKLLIRWCWPFSHFIIYGIGKNLVERLNINSLDRFNFKEKKLFSSMMAKIFSLPSNLLDKRFKIKSAMNIVILAKK